MPNYFVTCFSLPSRSKKRGNRKKETTEARRLEKIKKDPPEERGKKERKCAAES